MTLNQLRYLVMLAKEGNFSRAAERCHVSQPSLSVAIANLERELKVDIFERFHHEIRLTEAGKIVLQQAQRILEEADNLKQLAQQSTAQQCASPLRIGAIYTVAPYLLPRLVPQLREVAPQMPLILEEDFTKNLLVKLQQGDLDVIFVALPIKLAGIVSKRLYDEPFVVFMRSDHPLAKEQTIKRNQLNQDTVLLLGPGHCLRDQILTACPQCQSSPQNSQTVMGTSLETLRLMVLSGLGITILPSGALPAKERDSKACVRSFAGKPPQRQIGVAWRASFTRPQAIDALLKALSLASLQDLCLIP